MKIAILGGSFNPLHNAHAMLADTMIKEAGYDKVLFIPTGVPPHKEISSGISTEHRLGMVRAFCNSVPGNFFEVETCEIDRGGISYTVDTLKYIVQKYKKDLDGKPGLIMGEEIAAEFSKWKSPDVISELSDIIIVPRTPDYDSVKNGFHNIPSGHYSGDFNTKFDRNNFGYPCKILDSRMITISSTGIRERIKNNRSFRYLVPYPVFEYICENGLYK